MPTKISLDALDKVHIPDLGKFSEEETLFETKEENIHSEHKILAAQEATLGIAKERIRQLEIENDDLAMLGPHRRQYSWWILAFVIFFVITTLAIVVLSAWPLADNHTRTLITLDNEVLMTLLATNTVQVVGLLYVVAKWLFPTSNKRKANTSNS